MNSLILSTLPTLSVTPRQAQLLDQAVQEYVGPDRAFAVRHTALPIFHGWTMTIALCTDGRMLQWENDFGELLLEPIEVVFIRAALVRAAAIHPELASLLPQRPENAVICDMCAGTGVIKQLEIAALGAGCQCGGVGWLDPVQHRNTR